MKKVVIIGGGPSGMMAAISTKIHHPNLDVFLLESNHELGVKMKLSGGGRCNVSAAVEISDVITHIVKNGKFLYSSLSTFGPKDIQSFFEENDCPLKIEDHQRMFPQSNKASDIVDTLRNRLKELEVNILYDCEVVDVDEYQILCKDKTIAYDYLVLATGGKSYPETGSNGVGYSLAKKFNHTITKLKPAEVPLVSNDELIQSKALQGLSFSECAISIYRGKKIVKTLQHDLIFTHFGLSGPAALRASYYVLKELEKTNKISLTIDFLPSITLETLQVMEDEELIAQGISKRLLKYIDEQSTNKNERLQLIKKFPLEIYDTRGFRNAFVTNGGISIKEVDPKTMQSKLKDNLFFCGEILDYNAFTGGYNITAALSSGYTVGKYIGSQ